MEHAACMKKKGIDIKNHKNKQIDKNLVKENHIIICMTKEHKEFIVQNFNIVPYLFNEIAKGEYSDLNDDTEIDFNCTLHEFIEKTIIYIEKYIPNLIINLENY